MAFTCPRCGKTSHHPMDEVEGYCGNCHDWTAKRHGSPKHYVLNDDHSQRAVSFREYLECGGGWYRLKLTTLETVEVSTVFLGLDHNFRESGPPLCFETMTFDRHEEKSRMFAELMVRDDLGAQERYSTWDDAIAGHDRIVERFRAVETEALGKLKSLKPEDR